MTSDNPLYDSIMAALGDTGQDRSDTEQRTGVFNFEALKGTIANDEQFRIAVKGLQKFQRENPEAFAELEESMQQARDAKHDRLGIAGMPPTKILDTVLDDINNLPPHKRAVAFAKIARVRKNLSEGIDELGEGREQGGRA